ncbi:MAG: hypothetical protein K2N34_05175 [Lachnospiraceae bacterium]|nr:hypothetical protein [Lachnospiraceae bacterium]
MTGMEIFLIMVGIIAIVGSFVFSEKLEKADKNTENMMDKMSEEAIQKKVDEAVDMILDDKVEATEVKVEKILNEKILAVGEYSDNVISDINKSHDEVMFLYGMLNDKEKDIKKTVMDVENLKKSIKQNGFVSQTAEPEYEEAGTDIAGQESILSDEQEQEEVKESTDQNIFKVTVENTASKNGGVAISAKEVKAKTNNNDRILDLYKQGKTGIEIAKELKLGIGEVRLVIDLYKNR